MNRVGPFRAIDYQFTVVCDDSELSEIVESIFGHCADPGRSGGEELEIRVGTETSEWTTGTSSRQVENGRVVPGIVSHVNLAAAQRRARDFPVLHAGCVAVGDGAIVLPGPSGSGKSTLVATLLQRGAQYVADELVAVRATTLVEGYPKAITLKQGSWTGLGLERPKADGSGRFGSAISYVPPSAFNELDPLLTATPSVLVFPQHDDSQPVTRRALTPGETTTRLAACAYLPLSQSDFETLARLSSGIAAHEMSYPTTSDALETIDEISSKTTQARTTHVEVGRATDEGVIAEGTSWADFDTELVAANASNNAVVHLDEEGRSMWLGFVRGKEIPSGLKSELVRLGLVRG